MRITILAALVALAANLGCTKNDSSSPAAEIDATGAAKSAVDSTCPHHQAQAAGQPHDCKMHDGKPCECKAGEPCDCKAEGKPCDCKMGEGAMADCPMHAGKMAGGMMHGKMDGAGPMDPAAHVAKMTEALGLDADQAAKVQAVFTDFAPRQQALRERALALHQEMDQNQDDAKLDQQAIAAKKAAFAEVHAEKAKIHQELAAAIDAVLTPEQRARHQEMMAEHHGKGGAAGGPGCDGTCDSCAHESPSPHGDPK